jgi:nucleoside-diphosphate-sugar epimerase
VKNGEEAREMSEGKKETILVTGTSGRIGYPVAKRLAEEQQQSFNVIGFDRKAPSHPPPSAECLYVDLTNEESTRRGLQAIRDLHGDRIASVIHLAAYYDFSGVPSPLYDKVTVGGTRRLLRLLQEFKVEQFIFSSTGLVHAPSRHGVRINENSPLDIPPKWAYPRSKIETENVIHAEHGNIPVVILRVAGVYDDLCHSIPFAMQIQRIYERDIAAYFSPGDPSTGRQPYVHNDDVVNAILLAVAGRRELPPEVTLLIGEDESLSYDELQRAFGQLIHGVEWNTRAIPPRMAKTGVRFLKFLPLGRSQSIGTWMIDVAQDNMELDITRARKILGWKPRHSLIETLPKMVSGLKADPFTWYRENDLELPLWLRELMPVPEEDKAKEIMEDAHELMRLAEQVKQEIAASAPMSPPSSTAPKQEKHHDMMDMHMEDTEA